MSPIIKHQKIMKKLLLFCVVALAFISCQKYDDSELWGRIGDLEGIVSESETGDGLIVSMDFLAKHNPLNIAVDGSFVGNCGNIRK